MKFKKLKITIFGILAFVELCLTAIMVLLSVVDRMYMSEGDYKLGISLGVFFFCLFATSIFSIIRVVRQRYHVILTALVIKLMLFILDLSYNCSFDYGSGTSMGAAVGFGIMGMILMASAALLVVAGNQENGYFAPKNRTNFESYKVSDNYDKAEAEYLAMRYGIPVLMDKSRRSKAIQEQGIVLTAEDEKKIKEYAAGPIVYLLGWLFKECYMSHEFYQKHGFERIEQILKGYGTVLDYFLNDMNGVLKREDISNNILYFIDYYYLMPYGPIGENREIVSAWFRDYYDINYKYAMYDSMILERATFVSAFYCNKYNDNVFEILCNVISDRLKLHDALLKEVEIPVHLKNVVIDNSLGVHDLGLFAYNSVD